MRRTINTASAVLAAVLVSCAPKGSGGEQQTRHLRELSVPSVYTSPVERAEYTIDHYWDSLFDGNGVTDSTHILGVPKGEVEQHLSNYILMLSQLPLPRAGKAVESLFGDIEEKHGSDTASHCFQSMTEIVSRYLYDPNSPMRNEDLYLPFVQKLSSSEFTPQNMRRAYSHDAEMCSMNRFGEKVPDFRFRTLKGRDLRLYSVKAEYTMLFFSNPGCHACQGIISEVMSKPYISEYLANGTLAVVNVYIDEDVDAWKQYAVNYPESWYSGYDPDYVIREDLLYNVRAIPSLYLLDREKRVIMKDAPTENVLNYLDRIAKQTIQ